MAKLHAQGEVITAHNHHLSINRVGNTISHRSVVDPDAFAFVDVGADFLTLPHPLSLLGLQWRRTLDLLQSELPPDAVPVFISVGRQP